MAIPVDGGRVQLNVAFQMITSDEVIYVIGHPCATVGASLS
jgi:hypothetical protein